MDCPPGMGLHCPRGKARADVEAAIRQGVITWHAFPHNAQVNCHGRRKYLPFTNRLMQFGS